MHRPPRLDPADYEAYDVLEYRWGNYESNLWDEWAMLIHAINSAEERDPRLGGKIELMTDEIAKLPNGSYVAITCKLEVLDPAKAEAEIKDATQ